MELENMGNSKIDFEHQFGVNNGKYWNGWGLNWRAYMILRGEQSCNIAKEVMKLYPTGTILEVGCATGDITKELIDELPGGKIISVDCSDAAVNICKKRFSTKNNIEFKNMNLPNVRIETKADLIICMDVLQYFEEYEWKKCFDNILSNLTEDGYILFQIPLEKINKETFLEAFEDCFSVIKIDYVYGKLWYNLVERHIAGFVQLTYIERKYKLLYPFGYIGYKLLSNKRLVEAFYRFNRRMLKNYTSHLIVLGKRYL